MPETEEIVLRGLQVLPHERLVFVGGEPIELTSREFDILARLLGHPGWVYSAAQLSDADAEAAEFSPDSVSVHVSHLRRKLAEAGAPDIVQTVRGLGYRVQTEAAEGLASATLPDPGDRQRPEGRCFTRPLRDAFWDLEEAVLQVDHTGNEEQVRAAQEALEHARQFIYALLAE